MYFEQIFLAVFFWISAIYISNMWDKNHDGILLMATPAMLVLIAITAPLSVWIGLAIIAALVLQKLAEVVLSAEINLNPGDSASWSQKVLEAVDRFNRKFKGVHAWLLNLGK